jgi:hypothetical protein
VATSIEQFVRPISSDVNLYACSRPWRPIGLWDVDVPTFSTQSAHRWRWDCHPYAPAAVYPQGRFLVLISVRGWAEPRAIMRLEWLGKLKKSNDLIVTRTRELPACSIVPQLTTLPLVTCLINIFIVVSNTLNIPVNIYIYIKLGVGSLYAYCMYHIRCCKYEKW